MFKMRVKLCLIYLTLHLAQAIAGNNDGNCNIEGITDDDWINGYFYRQIINDLYYNFEVSFKSNTYIEHTAVANDDYLTATIDLYSSTVHITTNHNFQILDHKTPTTEKDLTITSQDFVFDCPDGLSTLTFLLIVQDSNSNDPIFVQDDEYYFLMPPRKKYEVGEDISQYGPQIIVADIDFSNQGVVFAVIPDGAPVTVETEYWGNKQYRAVFKVQNVNFTLPAEYSIVAYDRPFKPEEPIRKTRTVPLSFVEDGGIKLKLDSVLLLLVLTLTWLYNFQ